MSSYSSENIVFKKFYRFFFSYQYNFVILSSIFVVKKCIVVSLTLGVKNHQEFGDRVILSALNITSKYSNNRNIYTTHVPHKPRTASSVL